jgi:hypothetical protein
MCAACITAGTESGVVQGGGLLMNRADLSAALVRVAKHKVYTLPMHIHMQHHIYLYNG